MSISKAVYFANNGIQGFFLIGTPRLDRLVIPNSDKAFSIRRISDIANDTIVCQNRTRASATGKAPCLHLAVIRTAYKRGQLESMLAHAGYCILVTF